MDLIKEVAADKRHYGYHNPELAHKYADRIVEFSDGKVILILILIHRYSPMIDPN